MASARMTFTISRRAGALRIEEVNLAPASSAVMVSLERHQIP
jgi:hypothetical protein